MHLAKDAFFIFTSKEMVMVKVRDVIDVMESWAPSSLAESWDNVGLITGDPDSNVSHVIVTLDVTEEVLDDAIKHQAPMVISHHPPIFKPLLTLSGRNASQRIIVQAVKHDIPLFTAHTNLDQAPEGVSVTLAHKLGLHSVSFLETTSGAVKFVTFVPPDHTDRVREAACAAGAGIIGEYSFCSHTVHGTGTYMPSDKAAPYEGSAGELSRCGEDRIEMIVPSPFVNRVIQAARAANPYEEMAYDIIPLSNTVGAFGYGAVGELDAPTIGDAFIERLSFVLQTTPYHVSEGRNISVQRIAVFGGSGKDFIARALSARADVFVTGEIGYHDYLSYGREIMLVDATHRATELPVLETIQKKLSLSGIGRKISVSVVVGRDTTVAPWYERMLS